MVWTCHEEGMRALYTFPELHRLYRETVDKDEYPAFHGWLWDMERSAVLFRHE